MDVLTLSHIPSNFNHNHNTCVHSLPPTHSILIQEFLAELMDVLHEDLNRWSKYAAALHATGQGLGRHRYINRDGDIEIETTCHHHTLIHITLLQLNVTAMHTVISSHITTLLYPPSDYFFLSPTLFLAL